jgi:LEA14-like dessication related protein
MKNTILFKFCLPPSDFQLLIPVLSLLFSSCLTVQPVEVQSVNNFQLRDALTKPYVQFDVNIHNPNHFGLTLKEFKSTAYSGDKVVTDIFVQKKTRIAANSDISIPIQTTPSLNDISSMLFSGGASKDVKVDGYLTVRKFIFSKKFPFTIHTKF